MQTKYRISLGIFFLLLVFNLNGQADKSSDARVDKMIERVQEKLNLDESQLLAFNELTEEHRQKVQSMIENPEVSRADLGGKIKEAYDTYTIKVADILNEDQKKTWMKMQERKNNKMARKKEGMKSGS